MPPLMTRGGFLGALAAIVAAPRLLGRLAPAPASPYENLRFEDMPVGLTEVMESGTQSGRAESVAEANEIMDRLYPIIADGVTDNTVALRVRVEWCRAAGGGTINLPAGVIVADWGVLTTAWSNQHNWGPDCRVILNGAGPYDDSFVVPSGTFLKQTKGRPGMADLPPGVDPRLPAHLTWRSRARAWKT